MNIDIAQGLFYSIPITPALTIPLVWRFSNEKKYIRVTFGLVAAFFISLILYIISMSISFRNGLGPG